MIQRKYIPSPPSCCCVVQRVWNPLRGQLLLLQKNRKSIQLLNGCGQVVKRKSLNVEIRPSIYVLLPAAVWSDSDRKHYFWTKIYTRIIISCDGELPIRSSRRIGSTRCSCCFNNKIMCESWFFFYTFNNSSFVGHKVAPRLSAVLKFEVLQNT